MPQQADVRVDALAVGAVEIIGVGVVGGEPLTLKELDRLLKLGTPDDATAGVGGDDAGQETELLDHRTLLREILGSDGPNLVSDASREVVAQQAVCPLQGLDGGGR